MRLKNWCVVVLLLAGIGIGAYSLLAASGGGGNISLTALGAAYTQNFDTLTNGPNGGTSSTLPTGWLIDETGSSTRNDGKYTVGTGSDNAGDIYAYGAAAGNTDRALGTLRSGTLSPTIGASFTNNTGAAINQLLISYTGEQWRLGTSNRVAADRLDFQISTTATSLTTGTYSDVDSLDFSSPITNSTLGALNGNLGANRRLVSATISGVSIPNGATFFIRWTDFDVSGADDGLAIDDFSITPSLCAGLAGVGSSSPGSVQAGSGSLLKVTVTLASCPASTGIAVTADLTAIGGSNVQTFFDDGTHGDVTEGDNVFSFQTTVGVLTSPGLKNMAASISDHQGRTANATVPLTIEPPLLAIHDIQGNGNVSPFAGSLVSTTGIVTGVKTNGFFIQDPSPDSDPFTSEGIFVFTSSAPPAAAVVGNSVKITGRVQEFIPSSDPHSPSATEIAGSPVVVQLSTGNSLPPAVTLTAADMNVNNVNNIERYEGMRVHVDSLTVVGPTQGTINESNASSASSGVFYGVITDTPRPFREPGIQVPDPVPACATPPCTIPQFDANPERLRVDSDGIGAAKLEVTAGAIVTGLTGPLDYGLRTYTIVPDPPPAGAPSVSGNISAVAVPAAAADQFTIASFNMERFFDTTDDPGISDVALTTTAFNNRLSKASLAIRNVMRYPDIVGVAEMENLTTLQAVANKVNGDAIATGDPDPGYAAYLVEGNDVGGIDVGFLVKSARVKVIDVTQMGKADTYINPNNGQPELLNDRPPLILRAEIPPPAGSPYPVTVIANHLRSLSGIDDPIDGNRVRTKRKAQAEFLANLIQARQTADANEHIISIGDYNAFQFNDGYEDSIGTIKGTPTSADRVVLSSSDLVNPDLIELSDLVPATQQYSFIFDGNAQELDHVLITANVLGRFAGLNYARSNADFPESLRGDPSRPERLSDHDMPVAYFNFPKADLGITKTPSTSSPVAGSTVAYSINVTNSTYDAANNVVMTDPLPPNMSFQSLSAPAGWNCSTPSVGDIGTISCTNPSLPTLSAATVTAVLNVSCNVRNGLQASNTATVSSSTFDPDMSNNSMTANVTISNPPPSIGAVVVDQPTLWPPNHKMVDVRIDYTATDNCTPASSITCTLSVSSNEPVNGTGDGDTSPDWEIIDAHHVRLRAERAGNGEGRIYTITITCIDSGGNRSIKTVTVVVPHDRSK
jgi:uncharacterized repeat protein (TIGR01451 family)